MMTEHQTTLLRDWAEALDALDALGREYWIDKFYMPLWVANGRAPEKPDLSCGTVCCAYGLATTLPSWRAAGIGWHDDLSDSPDHHYFPSDDAQDRLGITRHDFNNITKPCYYPSGEISPRMVSDRIRLVIEDGQIP